MDEPRSFYSIDKPAHRLGQYRAWEIGGEPGSLDDLPLDLVWISVAAEFAPAAHRVLPHGEPSIGILRKRDLSGGITDIRLVLCGPSRRSLWYRPDPREELIAVRLKPEWSAEIFDICPSETQCIGENILDVPRRVARACEASMTAAEYVQAHQLAEILLTDLLRVTQKFVARCMPERKAIALIRQTEGRMKTRQLADFLDISERHLRRRFADLLGCSPKSYARQLRLSSTVIAAENCDQPQWAQLACAAGFTDQAHMINEYKSLLGLTPLEIQKERRALTAFCNS
ncbi:helix-turn-helix transcriptional regulator [Parasphingorhabdus sp.]|uniref:helix-turn-helix transcriptional regulator n=1 Tax=Parasphingorhabdus sp. TaxID=2709688 RepID=UPI00326786F2